MSSTVCMFDNSMDTATVSVGRQCAHEKRSSAVFLLHKTDGRQRPRTAPQAHPSVVHPTCCCPAHRLKQSPMPPASSSASFSASQTPLPWSSSTARPQLPPPSSAEHSAPHGTSRSKCKQSSKALPSLSLLLIFPAAPSAHPP